MLLPAVLKMRIAAGYPLLVFVFFLNSIELISSEPLTLDDLFPGYNGVIPPVERLEYRGQFPHFETFGEKHMEIRGLDNVLKRDHIIVGFYRGGFIEHLCRLFGLENLSIAFDTNKNEWFTLPPEMSRKLGVGRDYELVVARDEAANRHVKKSVRPVFMQAKTRACRQANDRADIVEKEQEQLLHAGQTTIENSIREIMKEYSRTYKNIYQGYLFRAGILNIEGYTGSY